jgi:general secretion pathway protein C
MTVYLRKYFWAINLLTIALCAFFAARAVGRLVDASLASETPRRVIATPPVQTTLPSTSRDITQILSRNIFCSTCERLVETPNKATADSKELNPNNEPVKTSLNLKLIATLVSDEDKAWSFAAILDSSENKSHLFAIGSKLPGEAVLTDVMERRVLLHNGNRNEYLDLETGQGGTETAAVSAPESVVSMRPSSGLSGMEEEVSKSIRKVAEGKYEVERSALNRVLANTTLLARSARIVPSVVNGQPNGFKLYAIRPGSVYSLLGMVNGDTINAINGHAMTTPDKALEVYTKLRNASHLTISYLRQGKTLTNEYTIR